jgi:hypothetical protein
MNSNGFARFGRTPMSTQPRVSMQEIVWHDDLSGGEEQ